VNLFFKLEHYRVFLEVCLQESLVIFIQGAEGRRWQRQSANISVNTVLDANTSDKGNIKSCGLWRNQNFEMGRRADQGLGN